MTEDEQIFMVIREEFGSRDLLPTEALVVEGPFYHFLIATVARCRLDAPSPEAFRARVVKTFREYSTFLIGVADHVDAKQGSLDLFSEPAALEG